MCKNWETEFYNSCFCIHLNITLKRIKKYNKVPCFSLLLYFVLKDYGWKGILNKRSETETQVCSFDFSNRAKSPEMLTATNDYIIHYKKTGKSPSVHIKS